MIGLVVDSFHYINLHHHCLSLDRTARCDVNPINLWKSNNFSITYNISLCSYHLFSLLLLQGDK